MSSTRSITALLCSLALLMAGCSSGGGQGSAPSGGGSAVIGTGGDGGDGSGNGGGPGGGDEGEGGGDGAPRIITALAVPAAGGSLTGAGQYDSGATATLRATANESYVFARWAELDAGDNVLPVTTDDTVSFTVTRNRDLIAEFRTQTELMNGVFSGVPKGGDRPVFDVIAIDGTAIDLLHVDVDNPFGIIDATVPWCRYQGTLSGIALPTGASGSYECNDGAKGTWTSDHVAKIDTDAFIIAILARPQGSTTGHIEKYTGFTVRAEAAAPAHHRRLEPYAFAEATPDDLTGTYHGYLKIDDPADCAPHEFDMIVSEGEITVAGAGIGIEQRPAFGPACSFSGTFDDIAATPPLSAAGTYSCDGGHTGTWNAERIALTSPARDAILLDLTVDVPAGNCAYRARHIGFTQD